MFFDTLFPWLYAGCFALTALIIQLTLFKIGDISVESDFYGDLVVAAQKLKAGEFAVASYPYKGPVYSFFLVAVQTVVGDWYRSGVVLNLLCAAGSLVLAYGLVRPLFGRAVAVLTVISVSLVFEFFTQAHKASSDLLFLLASLAAMSALLNKPPRWPSVAAAGALSALAFLTRYSGVFLPVAGVMVLLFVLPADRDRRRRLLSAATFLGAFLAVCSPWFAASLQATGDLIPPANLRNLVQEFYGAEASYLGAEKFDSFFAVFAHAPAHFAGHYLGNLPTHFWLDIRNMLGLFLGVPLILGLLRLLFVRVTRQQLAFFVFPTSMFLVLCLGFHLPRLSLLLTIPYAAIVYTLLLVPDQGEPTRLGRRLQGLGTIRRRLAATRPPVVRAVQALLVAAILVSQIWGIVRAERYFVAAQPTFILGAAEALRAEDPQGNRARAVMARKPHIAHYAGMRYVPYPNVVDDPGRLLAYARARKADFIVFSALENMYFPGRPFLPRLHEQPGVSPFYRSANIVVFALDGK